METTKKLKEEAIKALGTKQFESLYAYFKKFINSSVTENKEKEVYKIIKTRRAYVLYLVFLQLLIEAGEITTEDVKKLNIYNDIYIGSEEFITKCKEISNNILIELQDDILIQGRQLSDITELLIKELGIDINDIELSLIMSCKGAGDCSDNLMTLKKQLSNKNEFSPKESTKLSCQNHSILFMKLLQMSGISYSSFTDSYTTDGNLHAFKKAYDKEVYNSKLEPLAIQQHSGSRMTMHYSLNELMNVSKGGTDETKKVHSLPLYNVILEYENVNNEENQDYVVPFTVIPMITEDNLSEIIPNTKTSYIDGQKKLNKLTLHTKYKLLTNCVSNYYLSKLDCFESDYNSLRYSFNKDKTIIDEVTTKYEKIGAVSDSGLTAEVINILKLSDKSTEIWMRSLQALKAKKS